MNQSELIRFVIFAICVFFLPFITIGIIRRRKAQLQRRLGASILQPLWDFLKWFHKDQILSDTTTWIFRLSSAINLATMLLIAFLVPWVSFKPTMLGDDLFLVLYMFALIRFTTILSALDSGSPFGAFGASREAYLGMLVEPAMFISLAALGLVERSSNLGTVFDLSHRCSAYDVPVWLAAGSALFLASIVDLSRMPIDDPTTHLELTMVHEAMTIENSGRNLALLEFTHALKLVVLYGLTAQCLIHATSHLIRLDELTAGVLSVALIVFFALFTATLESVLVKLRWRSTPEFIAFALTMSLFATGGALVGEIYARHGL